MVGKLLSAPLEGSALTEVRFNRQNEEQSATPSDRVAFQIKGNKDFQRQFFHVYGARLTALRPRVTAAARELIGSEVPVVSLCDLDTHRGSGQDVVVVGTLFKHQPLKPNILKDLSEDMGLVPQPQSKQKFISDEDELVLEDESQRIKVRGEAVDKDKMATGIVCGLHGRESENGKFDVVQIIYPKAAEQKPRTELDQDRFIALVSGLELSDSSCPHLMPLQLAIDWLTGEAGEMEDQKANAAVERVIVAGNALSEATRDKEEMNKAKYLTKDNAASSIAAVQLLDDFLVQLSGSLNVDLMPGEFDPANQIMPQQPLHPCLFPLSTSYPTLTTVTNPFQFESHGVRILGFSGQNTDDILRNTSLEDPLDALEVILRASHMAPTCPDTLGCFPYKDKDPFIMKEIPHIVFTANQTKFDQRTFDLHGTSVQLLSVPKFSSSATVVTLNLKTLKAEETSFEVQL